MQFTPQARLEVAPFLNELLHDQKCTVLAFNHQGFLQVFWSTNLFKEQLECVRAD